jgi:hypothetical protein
VPEIEFLLEIAKSVLPGDMRKPLILRHGRSPFEQCDVEAARKWLDRATEHH